MKQDEKQGTTILYYPEANIYFDKEKETYIAFADESRRWERVKQLTDQQKQTLGRSVLVNDPTDPVWKQNSDHKVIYSALVYTSPDEVQRKFVEDSIRDLPPKPKPVKKEEPVEEVKEEKKKSGIARFFQRIFGKKKQE